MPNNENGFTLIEIIAVLVILGIIAAVAIPRYVSLMDQSRISTAQMAIAELKSRAAATYAKLLMSNNGSDPGMPAVQSSINTDVGSDFSGITMSAGNSNIVFTVSNVKGSSLSTAATGTWYYPTSG